MLLSAKVTYGRSHLPRATLGAYQSLCGSLMPKSTCVAIGFVHFGRPKESLEPTFKLTSYFDNWTIVVIILS